jgi:hypothetical protein
MLPGKKLLASPANRAQDDEGNPKTLCSAETAGGQKTVLEVWIHGHRLQALLDSGAMGNYISPAVINQHQLPWNQKIRPYRLFNVEGQTFDYNGGTIDRETDQLDVSI